MRTDEAARYHDTIVKHMCPCHAYACVIGFPEASWRAAFHFAELSGDEMGEGGHNKRANDCRLALHFHGDIEKGKANGSTHLVFFTRSGYLLTALAVVSV
jgi:hypothetical protein